MLKHQPYNRNSICIQAQSMQRRLRLESLEDRRLLDADPGWLRGIGGIDTDIGRGVTIDVAGAVYVSGTFRGTVDIDPGRGTVSLTSLGGNDIFVAKFSSSGTLAWARRMGGAVDDGARDIITDDSGNLYLVGTFQGSVDFDGDGTTETLSNGGLDAFVTRLSTNSGTTLWTRTYGGDQDDLASGVAIGPGNTIYLTGEVFDSSGTVDIDPGPGVVPMVGGLSQTDVGFTPNSSFYVLQLDSLGQYATSWGGLLRSHLQGTEKIAVDASGVYITGDFMDRSEWVVDHYVSYPGDFDFGPGEALHHSYLGGQDTFVAKYTHQGAFQWVRTLRGLNSGFGDDPWDIEIDETGVFVGGAYWYGLDVNEDGVADLPGDVDSRSYVARFSKSDGTLNWIDGLENGVTGRWLKVDGFGRVLVAGIFAGTVDFDPGPGISNLTANGTNDGFLLKLSPNTGAYQTAWRMGGASVDSAGAVDVDAAGLIYLVGAFSGTADFPNGGVLTSVGMRDVFLLKFNDGSMPPPSSVVGRYLFYNQSAFDGSSAAINTSDDAAIASDKAAYLPNNTLATFANVSSYSRGINGIMIDLAGGGDHASINANDFVFKIGNTNAPNTWAAVATAPTISVRAGAGVSGSDRVEITWASGSIRNTWLEVQVLPTANTGLTAADVFFWGNKIGDAGQGTPATTFLTSGVDKTSVLGLLGSGVGITSIRDFNRDNNVTAADATVAIVSIGSIVRLQVGGSGPFAPAGGESDSTTAAGDASIASALTTATYATPVSEAVSASPPRLLPAEHRNLVPASVTDHVLDHAGEKPQRLRSLPTANDQIGNLAEFDDDLLEELVAGLVSR